MKITYENEWEHTDIHIDMSFPYEEDYQFHMMKHNRIRHLLQVKGCGMNDGSRYTYCLGGGMSSMEKKYRTKEMGKDEILRFTEQLMETIDDLRKHLLDPDRLLLSPELIFMKAGQYYFCYLPLPGGHEGKPLCTAFHEMTEYFVKKLDYRDTDGVFLVYRIHRETMEETYDLREIMERCREEEKRRKETDETEGKREKGKDAENEIQGSLSEGAVFSVNDDGDAAEHQTYPERKTAGIVRESREKYGTVRRMVSRLKTGYWGEWEDLITEPDGRGNYPYQTEKEDRSV